LGAMDFLAFYQQKPQMPGLPSEPLYHTWGLDPVLDLAVAKRQVFGIESEDFDRAKTQAEDQRRRDAVYRQSDAMFGHLSDKELLKLAKAQDLT
ncbi:MAG: hypothetical protein AAF085_15015, partial [Planctomycetota bacterium]